MIKGHYGVFFILLLIITFSYGSFQGGFVSWFLFSTVSILSIYSWIVYKFSFKDIKVKRIFQKKRYTSGDDIEVEIEIMNRFELFPYSYILVADDIPEKLKGSVSLEKTIIYPWFRSKTFIRYTIPKSVRGIHRWKSIELVTGDVFGLISIRKSIPLLSEVMVYPRSFEIETWGTKNTIKVGSSFYQNKISEDTSSVIGIREYRKGDRFNRIHWRQSAKVMHLMTKEFERNITNDFLFFLDQENKIYPNQDLFEFGVELTASLTKHAIYNRFSAGIIIEGKNKNLIPLSRGKEQVMRIFEGLATVEADVNISLATTLLGYVPYFERGTTIVLVTPTITEELYKVLGELAFRKFKVEVFLIGDSKKVELQKGINQFNIVIHHVPKNSSLGLNGGIVVGQ